MGFPSYGCAGQNADRGPAGHLLTASSPAPGRTGHE